LWNSSGDRFQVVGIAQPPDGNNNVGLLYTPGGKKERLMPSPPRPTWGCPDFQRRFCQNRSAAADFRPGRIQWCSPAARTAGWTSPYTPQSPRRKAYPPRYSPPRRRRSPRSSWNFSVRNPKTSSRSRRPGCDTTASARGPRTAWGRTWPGSPAR